MEKMGRKWGQRPIFSSKNRALSPFSPHFLKKTKEERKNNELFAGSV